MPISLVEATDQIDRLIASRTGRDKANELEAMYAESVRRHRAKLRQENRALWYSHYMGLHEAHARISAEFGAKAEQLLQEGTA